MTWPHTFATQGGNVAASQLDDNFNAAALDADLDTLSAAVSALPSSSTPLAPNAAGSSGSSGTLSKADHRHPVQDATPVDNTGAVTIATSMNGTHQRSTDAGGVTYTFANSITTGSNGLISQGGAGQITFAAASGATLHQRQGFTKAAGQYAVVSWICTGNSGGSSAIILLSGDMSS